mgnify:CR=1 FL=1
MTIGAQLKKHRQKLGKTQREMGLLISPKAKRPARVWQDYESKKRLTDSNIKKLKRIGVSVEVTYKIQEDGKCIHGSEEQSGQP